jgi:hypothetical protein
MKKVLTAIAVTLVSIAASAQSAHCKGITKTGQPCHSIMVNKATGYCRMHDPAALHCSFIKKDGTQCKMVIKQGESLCRFHKA